MLTTNEAIEKCLYPEVRIRTPKALGSGTVIFCEPTPGEEGLFDAYVLTNEHVVDNLIEVDKKWDTVLKKETKQETLGHPDVEMFRYAWLSRKIGGTSFQADIMCYDKDEDMALLRVRSPHQFEHIATLYPELKIRELRSFMGVWNVGCGLGGPPAATHGFISAYGINIDHKDYMLVTANSIFGNSGGATFYDETGELVGIPSRITVTTIGWNADVVTHLGFSIPVPRIFDFLRNQVFDFIIDPSRTSTQCAEQREQMRLEDRLLRRREEEPEYRNMNPKGDESQKHRYYGPD